MNKAQAFTPDFIVATIMFILIMVILHIHIQSMYEKIENQERMIYYENLVSTTDLLLLYHGYPEHWNHTNVEVIGLAERLNYLNRTKVEEMKLLTNERIKDLLNLGGKSFYFSIKNSTDTVLEKGTTDWSAAENIYIINRNAMMDGASVEIRFLVW